MVKSPFRPTSNQGFGTRSVFLACTFTLLSLYAKTPIWLAPNHKLFKIWYNMAGDKESTKVSLDGMRTQGRLEYAISVLGTMDDHGSALWRCPFLQLSFSLFLSFQQRYLHNIAVALMDILQALLHRSVDPSSPKQPFHTIHTSFCPPLWILSPKRHPFHLFHLPIPSPFYPL